MKKFNYLFLPNKFELYNTGSLCYFNSLLQVLATCTSIYFIEFNDNNIIEKIFHEFIISVTDNKIDPLISSKMLKSLYNKNSIFGLGQESVSELFILLLNKINNKNLTELFMHRFRSRTKCNHCNFLSEEKKEYSTLFTMFHIDNDNINEKTIMYYETIINDYKCEKCNKLGVTKKCRLTMLPEIIFCIFNIYYEKKINYFPSSLQFPSTNNSKIEYTIIGQIEHEGSLSGGHYWAKVIRRDGIFLCNDSILTNGHILSPSKNTYVIVYHLI